MTYVVEDSDKPKSIKWFRLWWNVWGHPSVKSFKSMLDESNDSAGRGFTWVGRTVLTLFAAFLASIILNGNYANLSTNIIGTSIFIIITIAIMTLVVIFFG